MVRKDIAKLTVLFTGTLMVRKGVANFVVLESTGHRTHMANETVKIIL